jgi:hypothetical protein
MDVLQNQIVERKVLELVQAKAKFKDEAYVVDGQTEVEAISIAAGGGDRSAAIHDASGDSGDDSSAGEKSDDEKSDDGSSDDGSGKDETSAVTSAD